jgi:hypothetical protein
MDYRFIKTFAKRSNLSKPVYERVVSRWEELGFEGRPPAITTFEDLERLPETEPVKGGNAAREM